MSEIVISIANKRYSSWSLRGWLALKATGAPFREDITYLQTPTTRQRLLRYAPTARVPALRDGDIQVWESLAVCEHLAERFPAAKLWPDEPVARGFARSVATEMHGSFAALRSQMPMDLMRRIVREPTPETAADIARIVEIWRECRQRFGGGGPMLFGRFSIADCMYAPVATRFLSYSVQLDPVCAAYCEAVMQWPAMVEWKEAAARETQALPYP